MEVDYEDRSLLMQQALGSEECISSTDINLNKPPTSGAEYLFRVR